jgi:hypothetical protein
MVLDVATPLAIVQVLVFGNIEYVWRYHVLVYGIIVCSTSMLRAMRK